MSWALNNVTTKDKYEAATTIETGLAKRATIDVYNKAIFVSVLTEPRGVKGQAQWQPERFAAPGSLTLARKGLFGVRVRSAVKGEAAQVTIEVLASTD